AWNVVRSYLLLSLLCMLGYGWLGMNWFDAINHGMSTVATGGFGTSDASFGKFDSLPMLWVASLFMLAGAIPFVLYFRSWSGRGRNIVRVQQVRGMLLFLAVAIFTVSLARVLAGGVDNIFHDLSHTVFTVVSVITTTGFA